MLLIIGQVQQVGGSVDDTLECPERLYYHSKNVEERTSS